MTPEEINAWGERVHEYLGERTLEEFTVGLCPLVAEDLDGLRASQPGQLSPNMFLVYNILKKAQSPMALPLFVLASQRLWEADAIDALDLPGPDTEDPAPWWEGFPERNTHGENSRRLGHPGEPGPGSDGGGTARYLPDHLTRRSGLDGGNEGLEADSGDGHTRLPGGPEVRGPRPGGEPPRRGEPTPGDDPPDGSTTPDP